MLGLVLTAGGARGAYQAGVLARIAEIPALRDRPSPFAIVAGASAGAINGTILAARSSRFGEAAKEIAAVWSGLRVEQVFRTDVPSLAWGGASLARDFLLGGLLGSTGTHGLFDTSPLESLLEEAFPARGIAEAIRRGHLYAVAVSTTSYHSGRSYTFVQGRRGHPVWTKSRRVVLPVTLTHRHILASGAIPIVFPPVCIRSSQGELWFGDGGLRLVAPMSPAIRLGARHLFSIGVRSARAADSLANEEVSSGSPSGEDGPRLPCPPLAQVCGVFMNAIFLDHLDTDFEHLRRMNDLLAAHGEVRAHGTGQAPGGDGTDVAEDGMEEAVAVNEPMHEPMRRVEAMVVSPSEDLALVAQRFAHRMPRLVRYLLDGLGTPDAQSADLMSYLLFDAAYTRTLVDIGYRDAGERIDEIEDFLRSAGSLGAAAWKTPEVVAARARKLAAARP